METFDVAIIGGGPAGRTAAIYAARANANAALVYDAFTYTALSKSTYVENYPGFFDEGGKGMSGFKIQQFISSHTGRHPIHTSIQNVTLITKENGLYKIVCADETTLAARVLILCTGRKPVIPAFLESYYGASDYVSTCAVCDANFDNQVTTPVAIIGSGDTAASFLLYFKNLNVKVFVFYRGNMSDEFRKTIEIKGIQKKTLLVRIIDQTSFNVINNYLVVDNNAYNVARIFLATGATPNLDYLAPDLRDTVEGSIRDAKHDQNGCLSEDETIYIAGDLRKRPHYQAIVAASDGCLAALAAVDYINRRPTGQSIQTDTRDSRGI